MNENVFKVLVVAFVLIVLYAMFGPSNDRYNISVTQTVSAADGLDLQSVGDLIKKAKSAEELEKLLNEPGGINNLDLDENGKVDFINVEEFKTGKGFTLFVRVGEEDQEIASISVEKVSGKEGAQVEVHGNENVYGHGHYYRHHYSSFLLMGYLYSPLHRPYFHNPYYFGYYPSYYRSYGHVGSAAYRTRTTTMRKSSGMSKSSSSGIKSKGSSSRTGKSSSKVKAPLKSPTASQKSFQKSNPSKSSTRSGGFGSRSSSSSYRGSSRSSSFRGGK